MSEADDTRETTTAFCPFNYGRRQRELSEALNQRLRDRVYARQERVIDSRNRYSYRHGQEWSLSHSTTEPEFSRFHTARADASIWYQDIADNRLNIVEKYIDALTNEFERQFYKDMFKMLDEVTAKTGNVVRSNGNMAQGFIDMLSKIEIGVDRYGRPTMPMMMVHPEQFEKMKQEVESQPPEVLQELEELKQRKEIEATIQEAERISKFRW